MNKVLPDWLYKAILGVMLTIICYFMAQTFATIKSLEKDVISIREKILVFEATRLSRKEIVEMIADYHTNHPCAFRKEN